MSKEDKAKPLGLISRSSREIPIPDSWKDPNYQPVQGTIAVEGGSVTVNLMTNEQSPEDERARSLLNAVRMSSNGEAFEGVKATIAHWLNEEREECAKIAESYETHRNGEMYDMVAADIRARKTVEKK